MEKKQNKIKSVKEILKLIELNQFDDAEKELLKVIELKKGNYYAHFLLGNLYVIQKKFKEGLDQLKLSYKLNPKDKNICYNLGIVFDELGELEQSQSMFEKTLLLDSEYLNANLALAKNYEKQNNLEKAKYFYEKTLKINKDFYLANQMYGKFLIKIGEINKGQFYKYKFSGVIRFEENKIKIL